MHKHLSTNHHMKPVTTAFKLPLTRGAILRDNGNVISSVTDSPPVVPALPARPKRGKRVCLYLTDGEFHALIVASGKLHVSLKARLIVTDFLDGQTTASHSTA